MHQTFTLGSYESGRCLLFCFITEAACCILITVFINRYLYIHVSGSMSDDVCDETCSRPTMTLWYDLLFGGRETGDEYRQIGQRHN